MIPHSALALKFMSRLCHVRTALDSGHKGGSPCSLGLIAGSRAVA